MHLTRAASCMKRLGKGSPPLNKGMWQDPVLGYFETHGKMEFKPGEEYDLNEEQKKAVMERYKMKELLKQRFLEMEYNPLKHKYVGGLVMDPAIFRWYAAEMDSNERFRITPKTVMMGAGLSLVGFYLVYRICTSSRIDYDELCEDGEYLWWDRKQRWWSTGGVGKAGFFPA